MSFTDQEIRSKALQLESAGAPLPDIEEFVKRAKSEQVSSENTWTDSKGVSHKRLPEIVQTIAHPFLKAAAGPVTLLQSAGDLLSGDKQKALSRIANPQPVDYGPFGTALPVGTGVSSAKEVFTKGLPDVLSTGTQVALNRTLPGAGKVVEAISGKALSKVAPNIIPTVTKFNKATRNVLPNVTGGAGTAATFQGASNVEQGRPLSENIGEAGLIGGGLGVIGTGVGIGLSKVLEKPTVSEAVQRFRDALNIHKVDYNRIEKKAGKELDDVLQFSLEEMKGGAPIPVKTVDGKINTKQFAETLKERKTAVDQQLADVLDNTFERTDLNDIRTSAKQSVAKKAQNAHELNQMNDNIDRLIDAEIERYGNSKVTDAELHTIKNGMWGLGYDINNRTLSPVARKLGFYAKDAIEKNNQEINVKQMNQLSGMYQNAIDLFGQGGIHGRVVQGGKISGFFDRAIGGFVIDRLLGNVPYVGQFAALIGQHISKVRGDFIRDPERIARDAIKMARKAGLDQRSLEVVNQFEKNIPLLKGRQFMDQFKAAIPQMKLLPAGTKNPPTYTGKGNYVPGSPTTPTENVTQLPSIGVLEGQSKLGKYKGNGAFQESSGVQPVYPPVRSENRMLPPGNRIQSRINQGRSIEIQPTNSSREYVGPETSVGKYTPPKETPLRKQIRLNDEASKKVINDTLSGKREHLRVSNNDVLNLLKTNKVFPKDATPEMTIKIYKAANEKIGVGNHVTTARSNAKSYESKGKGPIQEMTVKIKDLVRSEGRNDEFIYSPKKK